ALLLALRPTYTSFALSQTNFLVFALVLVAWRWPQRAAAGICLACASIAKPLLLPLLIPLCLRGQRRVLAAAALTVIALSAATGFAYGIEPFASYLFDNPVARRPDWVYEISENQSLLAVLVRLSAHDFAAGTPLLQPLYLSGALVMIAVLIWLARRTEADSATVLPLALATALLLYPQSWEHYTVVLILPMMLLWQQRELLRLSPYAAALLMALLYALLRYHEGTTAIVATATAWILLATLGWRAVRVARLAVLSSQPPAASLAG
ncbi:MAG TPA: glycosyltransferase family 87 protein, partial [Terriglobales bacterium]|nr:glycosyltransferase family 87 protein [Terriglobales bacterium]